MSDKIETDGGDANRLGRITLSWEHDGVKYPIAPPDLDVELIFQSLHEAWAINQLEARKSRIGKEAYRELSAQQADALDGNAFAFGGDKSFRFLVSNLGMAEYFGLLMDRAGGPVMAKTKLLALARSGDEAPASEEALAWGRLWKPVMRRDHPNRFAPEALRDAGSPPSGDGATPSTGITASS